MHHHHQNQLLETITAPKEGESNNFTVMIQVNHFIINKNLFYKKLLEKKKHFYEMARIKSTAGFLIRVNSVDQNHQTTE